MLCLPKPIFTVCKEEIEPPTKTNISPTKSKGPKRKTPLVTAKIPKPKPTAKKNKGNAGIAQSHAAAGLYELKSSLSKTDNKPTTKKKLKDEGKGLMVLPTIDNRGKNVVGWDSKGDTMVVSTLEIGVENTNMRRSGRLTKNNNKV